MTDPFLSDFHIHVTALRRKDPSMTVGAVVARARELGLHAVGLLEHLAPSRGRPVDALEWIRDELARADVPAGLRVFRGVEIDVTPDGMFEGPPDVRERLALDYVIAAVHGAPKGVADADVLDDNFRRMMKVLGGPVRFEVLAHPWRSVLSRAGRSAGAEPTFNLVTDAMQRAVIDACTAKGVAIEVNAGAMLDDPAHDAFLRSALEAGLQLSLGSDAHFLERVGAASRCAEVLERIDATRRDVWLPGTVTHDT